MALKDIFNTKKPFEGKLEIQQDNPVDSIAVVSGASYKSKGHIDAGACRGSSLALQTGLQAVYMQLARYIQQDKRTQDERKNKTKQEISGLVAKNANVENKIKAEQDKLTREENKIEKTIKEIYEIKENPRSISGDSFARASFWIGLVIILFLTVYLFVFYSSASFSAFFKELDPSKIKISDAIFDAQAISNAWDRGFTALIFILAIPAVFLGLGFLIHKFSEEKGMSKYLKISSLIAVTFIFDFIIAYEILGKISKIMAKEVFALSDMTISKAVQDVNFWAIIFAGFIVYIIWGLVFDFTMREYEKMDKVRYAIRNKEQKLAEYKIECKQIRDSISNLQSEKDSTQGEIDKLKIQLENYVLYFNDVREGVNNYFSGWIGYLKSTAASQVLIHECNQINEKFLFDLQNSEFIKK